MTKRLVSLVLAVAMLLTMASALAEEKPATTYGPIANNDVTLTIWYPMEDNAAPYIDTIEDNLAWAEIERRLGIQIKFIMPPASNRAEMFQLLMASDELPDIIQYTGDYVGGGEKAVQDGVFLDLTELIPQYCPDYLARMQEDPSRIRDCMEDSGMMYWMKNIMNRRQQSYCGLMIRGDWLDKLGLEMPTTYAEMHDVLVAFKENCTGGEAPLELYQDGIGVQSGLIGGFGVEADPTTNDWFFFDEASQSVVCSVFQDGFKRYVERWRSGTRKA